MNIEITAQQMLKISTDSAESKKDKVIEYIEKAARAGETFVLIPKEHITGGMQNYLKSKGFIISGLIKNGNKHQYQISWYNS